MGFTVNADHYDARNHEAFGLMLAAAIVLIISKHAIEFILRASKANDTSMGMWLPGQIVSNVASELSPMTGETKWPFGWYHVLQTFGGAIGWTLMAVGLSVQARNIDDSQLGDDRPASGHLTAWGVVPCVLIWFFDHSPYFWGGLRNFNFVMLNTLFSGFLAMAYYKLMEFGQLEQRFDYRQSAMWGAFGAYVGGVLSDHSSMISHSRMSALRVVGAMIYIVGILFFVFGASHNPKHYT